MLKFFTEEVLSNPGEGMFTLAFKQYQSYIDKNESYFSNTILNLVRSDWYFNARDSKCPKDGWLISKTLNNNYDTRNRVKTPAQFELVLLGAYHDCHLKFIYKNVSNLFTDGYAGSLLEQDYDPWRIDEFTVDNVGTLTHSIYFLSGKVWIIECTDFCFTVEEF